MANSKQRRTVSRKTAANPTQQRIALLDRERQGINKFITRLAKLKLVHGQTWADKMRVYYKGRLSKIEEEIKALG